MEYMQKNLNVTKDSDLISYLTQAEVDFIWEKTGNRLEGDAGAVTVTSVALTAALVGGKK